MIRKSFTLLNGVKNTIEIGKPMKKEKHNIGIDPKERIDNCLHCTKPASECKGNCYGR